MPYAELFGWWIATITWSIAFPIVVSVYLYRQRPRKQPANAERRSGRVRDFTFVWFLLGLLVFYVISVSQGSALLFAVGNVAVEGLLLLYVFRSGKEEIAETPT
jgi:Na+/H+ antiporter NhaD/arsenite permease-like protein